MTEPYVGVANESIRERYPHLRALALQCRRCGQSGVWPVKQFFAGHKQAGKYLCPRCGNEWTA